MLLLSTTSIWYHNFCAMSIAFWYFIKRIHRITGAMDFNNTIFLLACQDSFRGFLFTLFLFYVPFTYYSQPTLDCMTYAAEGMEGHFSCKLLEKTAAGGQGTDYVNNWQALLAAAESIYENPARRHPGASLVVVNG